MIDAFLYITIRFFPECPLLSTMPVSECAADRPAHFDGSRVSRQPGHSPHRHLARLALFFAVFAAYYRGLSAETQTRAQMGYRRTAVISNN